MESICLAGDGWGVLAAYKGLKLIFNRLEICTNDADLISIVDSNDSIINSLESTKSNIIICAGYKPIVNDLILECKVVLNIHYSLLPRYRGLHSTVWAILNDEKYLGLSIHLMNKFIDDGPIIIQYKLKNDGFSSATYYINLFNDWVSKNLGLVITDFINGKIIPKNQNINYASWVGKRSMEDCKINFNNSHKYIQNLFRVLTPPYPRPFFRLKLKPQNYIVNDVSFLKRKIHSHIGRILNIDDKGIYVSSREGYVILSDITDENLNKIDYSFFKIGTFLES